MSEEPKGAAATPEDDGRNMIDEVEDLVRAGRPRLAAQALVDAFEDCLPDLPLRFSLLLVRVDEHTAKSVARLIHEGEPISLTLGEGPKSALSVFFRDTRVGDLSARDAELVREFGEHAALYTPRVLQILFRPDNTLQAFAVELVRPEQPRRPGEGGADSSSVALGGALNSLISARSESRRRRPRS